MDGLNIAGTSGRTRADAMPGLRSTLDKGSLTALMLIVLGTVQSWHAGAGTQPTFYFFSQDIYLLFLAAATLALLARARLPLAPLTALDNRTAAALVAGAAMIAYVGSFVVMERYGLSRDEQLADFTAEHLRAGTLAHPIPPGLKPLARAIMPLWADMRIPDGYWMSGYLPVNSILRAAAACAGDAWFAGPFLLAVGAGSIWSAARRLWPGQKEGATVALVLALTSTQLLVTAMTPYAMTGHFALDALWIALFLRGGRLGHVGALLVGLLATGLHQFHLHILFVSGFIAWMVLSGRYRLAALYALACLAYIAWWIVEYPHLLDLVLGSAAHQATEPPVSRLANLTHRLRELEPITSLARFIAWQNILMVPLALVGAQAWRDDDGRPGIVLAFALSCLAGLATMVFQGHGYGYRYLSGMIPCFCLLGASGWLRLRSRDGMMPPAALLWASALVTLTVALPFAAWRSHQFLHPYAAAYRAVRAARADVVLVDVQGGAFLQDIVRLENDPRPPLLLDLGYLDQRQLLQLCRTRHVMVFGRPEASRLGIPAGGSASSPAEIGARNLAWAARLGCTQRVPVAAIPAWPVRDPAGPPV